MGCTPRHQGCRHAIDGRMGYAIYPYILEEIPTEGTDWASPDGHPLRRLLAKTISVSGHLLIWISDRDLHLRSSETGQRGPNNGHLGPHLGPFHTSLRRDGTIWRPHIPVYRGRALRAPSGRVSACSKWWSGALRPCSKSRVEMGYTPCGRPIPRDITPNGVPSEGSDEAILT